MLVLIFEISDSAPTMWYLQKYIQGINQVAISQMSFISPLLSDTMGNLQRQKKPMFLGGEWCEVQRERMRCRKQKMTELREEKSSTTFGEKWVYTQEKIEVIDDIQIKRKRILKSLNNESFKRHFGGGSCQKIYLNCAAVLLKKKTRDPCKYIVRET